MMSEYIYTASFYVFAALVIVSALGVVRKTNIMHAALLLVLCFIGVSGLYVLLEADYLAAVQILVYGGAVAIIIILSIMLTHRRRMEETSLANNRGRAAVLLGFVFMALLALVIVYTPWSYSPAEPAKLTVFANVLLTGYVLPFEIAAVLLLAAMIGAVLLAKGVEEE